MKLTFSQDIIDAYQAMYAHTKNECAHVCQRPRSCCSPEYGVMAEKIMRMAELPVPAATGNTVCKFLAPTGCIVAPHLRPICTVHACCINSIGYKRGDMEWTNRYFELRARIDELEANLPVPVWEDFPV